MNWIKNNKAFLLAIVIPLLILLGMLVQPIHTMLTGERIVLKTVPIDPRDLLYGDYVTLRYEIEEIPVALADKKLQSDLKRGYSQSSDWNVYILLEKEATTEDGVGIYDVKQVSYVEPLEGIYLKASAYYFIEEETNTFHVDVPLERYYVQEYTGLELEEAAREGEALVYLKVKDGYGIMTDVQVIKK